jgi:exosortase A
MSNLEDASVGGSPSGTEQAGIVRRERSAVPWAGLAALGIALAGLYWNVVPHLIEQWADEEDYTHGFLILPLSLYFVWEKREKLKGMLAEPSLAGAGLLAVGLLTLVLGVVGAELFLQRFSLILVLGGLVWLLLGRAFLRELVFPLAFLIFVMNAIAFPLQLFAAQTATVCMQAAGVPVLREGNVIVLSNTTLEVVEACSGIRSLQALLALGAVYGYFTQKAVWKRWALLFLSIPIAILANAFRVAGTGFLAQYIGAQAAQGFYHSFAGWIVFAVAFVLLLGTGTLLGRLPDGAAARAEAQP